MPTMALCKRWQFISPPIEVGEFLLILVKYSKRLIDIPPAFNSVSILTSRCFKFGVEVIDKFFSFKLWLKSREFIVTPFDTFSRTANQCENSIAVYCFSIRLPQKAKKRVQNNVLDLSMTSRIVYCPSTLLFLFLTFPLRSINGVSKKVNFQT